MISIVVAIAVIAVSVGLLLKGPAGVWQYVPEEVVGDPFYSLAGLFPCKGLQLENKVPRIVGIVDGISGIRCSNLEVNK